MVKREELYYDSRDGISKIHAVKWIPAEKKPIAVLQICHGMSEYILRYHEFAEFLAEKGILVTGNDHLGHGLSKREDKPYGYFCERDAATVVVRDVHRLKKTVQEENPGVPYFILGHSMGSFILRNYLGRYGSGIDGAIIVGTGSQSGSMLTASRVIVTVCRFFLGGEHDGAFLHRITFGNYLKKVADKQSGNAWLSADQENVKAYEEDPLCGFIFTLNGFETLERLTEGAMKKENIAKIPKELPILFLAGEGDPVGNYGKGVTETYEKFCAAGIRDISIKLYPDFRHEILNETGREQVYEEVAAFVEKRLKAEVLN